VEDFNRLRSSIDDRCSDSQVVGIVHIVLSLDLKHERMLGLALDRVGAWGLNVAMGGRSGGGERRGKEREKERRTIHDFCEKPRSRKERKLQEYCAQLHLFKTSSVGPYDSGGGRI
jgi:hypothetical protein